MQSGEAGVALRAHRQEEQALFAPGVLLGIWHSPCHACCLPGSAAAAALTGGHCWPLSLALCHFHSSGRA